ncbi:acyl-CoA dehydrogenase family protein [Thalassotalea ponticola]|uniref:acyl-CoA dehydrogenase family protein n=1 Tax=Thalassotalea ponticola TaxID=1523392 RepID=UPI0025B4F52A|nr:acyl-CoA dehydrogenase family protein [Thalassotalea ponticola]MDN3653450.1 acyl-CoA dehydrogenase family protein [Thalassotalea ponticola]
MDFQLSEDQNAIADMANGLFADFCSDEQLLAYSEANKTVMDDAWQAAKDTGLHNLLVPESLGGSGLGMQELMVVLVAQGRNLAQVPLWRNQVAISLLAPYMPEGLQPLLERASVAEDMITIATAQHQQSRGLNLTLSAQGTVSGTSIAVADVDMCRYALLPAKQADKQVLVLVDLKAEQVTAVEGVMTHGGTVADIQCDGVEPLVVLSEDSVKQLNCWIIACYAALQVGVSERQLERTVEYVSERVQFDRPIGSFQAVQMSLADCHISAEALRTCLWQLCYRIDAGLPCQSEALATAYHACETGHIVGHKAQHVHGGFGVDISYPMYRFLYWSREISAGLGGSRAALEELGQWLGDNDVLGWKYDLE